MSWLKDYFPSAIAICALFALGAAICQSLRGELKSATLLAGIFVAAAFIVATPLIDTFKAFSVEVKLRASLDRADDLLAQIKKASIASAKASYQLTAWGGRWGGMSRENKQKLLDAVDAQLTETGVDEAERRAIVKPHVNLIAYDLYYIFYQTVDGLNSRARLQNQMDPALKAFFEEWPKQLQRANAVEWINQHTDRGKDFYAFMAGEISKAPLEKTQVAKLDGLAQHISEVYEECRKAGGLTKDALAFFAPFDALAESGGMSEAYAQALDKQ